MKSSFAEFHPQWLGDVPSLRWSRWLPEPCLYSPFPTGHSLSSGSAPVALASAPSQAYSTRCRWIDVNVAVPSDRAILFRTITPEKLGTTVLSFWCIPHRTLEAHTQRRSSFDPGQINRSVLDALKCMSFLFMISAYQAHQSTYFRGDFGRNRLRSRLTDKLVGMVRGFMF